jgi:hypothetical protein
MSRAFALILALLVVAVLGAAWTPAVSDEPVYNALSDPDVGRDTATGFLVNRIDPSTPMVSSTPEINADLREAQLRPDTGGSPSQIAAAGFGEP